MPEKAVVTTKSAWLSKINWGEGAKVLGLIATMAGVPADVQADVLAGIIGAGAVYTWVMKTWFTPTVTPASVGK